MKVVVKGNIVFIPIEIKNREYKAKLLLANYFLNEGYSVAIGSIWHMDKFLINAKNSIYITKDFYKYRCPFLNELHENNNFVVAWDEEGLIYDSDERYTPRSLCKDTLSVIDLIITWGKRQKRTIESFLHKQVDRVLALGNPRLDLLKLDIAKKIFESEISQILHKFGSNYILINSNFSLATRDNYDAFEHATNNNGKHEKSIELTAYYIDLAKALAPLFFLATKHIAKKFPTKKIIFRPHPAENTDTIQNIFKDYENIYVVKKFAVNPWLACASVIIHNGCTTGMEAAMMGKKVISYQPDISIAYEDTIPDRLSKIVKTEIDLLNILDSIINDEGSLLTYEQKNLLYDYITFDENETCSKKIIKAINSVKSDLRNGEFTFNNSLINFNKYKKMRNFNIEFEALNYKELNADILNMKKAMSFNYKQKTFILTENVFFIANKNSKIKFMLDFKQILIFIKEIIKKIFKR